MKCPFCRQSESEVYNSRATKFGSQTWRRRRCLKCGKSFTTYEAADLSFLVIASQSGHKSHYNRAKLFSDLYEAFLGVPHKAVTIDAVTSTIEAKLLDLRSTNITTAQVANT